MRNVLVTRMDSAGDVLLAGPAIRAVAGRAQRVTLLAGPRGRAAADLLPDVDEVLQWQCPWADPEPGPTLPGDVLAAVAAVRRASPDAAVILTSPHQDPLPTALVLRMAGVPRITAACEDYPGSLLDVRHRLPDRGLHEAERMLSIAEAAGFPPPQDKRLRLRRPLPDVSGLLRRKRPGGYVVVHPGGTGPASAPLPERAGEYVAALAADGWPVVVTGQPSERSLTGRAAGFCGLDLGGRTSLAELAAVLDGAAAIVTGDRDPAHLAAATGTPVVSLFPPIVPERRWRPWGVPHMLLDAATTTADRLVAAVRQLVCAPAAAAAPA